jgi:hypothetical protein
MMNVAARDSNLLLAPDVLLQEKRQPRLAKDMDACSESNSHWSLCIWDSKPSVRRYTVSASVLIFSASSAGFSFEIYSI